VRRSVRAGIEAAALKKIATSLRTISASYRAKRSLCAKKLLLPPPRDHGRNNGGLLVGVASTQHPEYYHGVVANRPCFICDPAPSGASWIGEYGDPDNAKMAEV